MKVAPEADPSDGLLDVVAMVDLTRAQGIALAQHIYRGSHVGRPGVSLERGAVVEAEALVPGAEVLIDLDGETPGRLPLRARLAKGAVRSAFEPGRLLGGRRGRPGFAAGVPDPACTSALAARRRAVLVH